MPFPSPRAGCNMAASSFPGGGLLTGVPSSSPEPGRIVFVLALIPTPTLHDAVLPAPARSKRHSARPSLLQRNDSTALPCVNRL